MMCMFVAYKDRVYYRRCSECLAPRNICHHI